jgi:hypothetical protein
MAATMRLISICALFAALAACTSPTTRGPAYQGISPGTNTAPSPYYLGADPAFRPKGGSGG